MFSKYNPDGFLTPVEGIEMKTLVYGENTLMTRFHLKKDSTLPKHSHPHEQTGFMVSGQLKLFMGEHSFIVDPGDAWTVKANEEHWAEIIEDSVVIEVFSPVREDYLPG